MLWETEMRKTIKACVEVLGRNTHWNFSGKPDKQIPGDICGSCGCCYQFTSWGIKYLLGPFHRWNVKLGTWDELQNIVRFILRKMCIVLLNWSKGGENSAHLITPFPKHVETDPGMTKQIFCELPQRICTLWHISQGKSAVESLQLNVWHVREQSLWFCLVSSLEWPSEKKTIQDTVNIYICKQREFNFFMWAPSELGINLLWPGRQRKITLYWNNQKIQISEPRNTWMLFYFTY